MTDLSARPPTGRATPGVVLRPGGTSRPAAVGFVPVAAKLRRPRSRDGLVVRRTSAHLLAASAEQSVILVAAPSGYGKTTLLTQWADRESRPVAWVSLEDSDNDPGIFLAYLLLALERVQPLDPAVAAALRTGGTAVFSTALPRLGRALMQLPPFVLMLDDAHRLTDPVCLDVLTMLFRHLPAGSQVVLAARGRPALPWGRLRAQGRVRQVGTMELTLSLDEGRALLAAEGLNLHSDDAVALMRRTEGWPAGLHLAALTIRAGGGGEDSVARFLGDETLLADYLRDDLLARTTPDQQAFLTRTSILQTVSPELCDAVLQTHGSGSTLRELAESDMFLAPMDQHQKRFRYHGLFARMLRSELRQREPEAEVGLHARASEWLAEHGDMDEAITHAHAAGDLPRAAELVWSQVPWRLGHGEWATLETWVAGFAADEVLAQPLLALAAAWCAVPAGRDIEPWLAAAERADEHADAAQDTGPLTSAVALLRATLAAEGIDRMRQDAELAEQLQAPEDPWRSLALFYQGVAAQLSGEPAAGQALFEQAEQLATALDVGPPHALSLAQLSLEALDRGAWTGAEELAARGVEVVERYGLQDMASMGPVACVSALMLAHRGELDRARVQARRARRQIAVINQVAPWLAVEARVVLARTYLLLGDPAAARVLLSEGQNLVSQVPDGPVLQEWLDDGWRMVQRMPVTTALGPSALTAAELRVVQYLPTHLSFEEIGRRLFLSRNTVKTQAISAYRKLGVSSRADAVEQAQAFGVLRYGDPATAG
jgi:LuxR family transcriptional regulator, maltose regulon positive regulatory protein